MEKLKVLMMFFVVLIGLAGSFAFKAPTIKKTFAAATVGVLAVINCPISGAITIATTNVVDVTGQEEGSFYDCSPNNRVCVLHLPNGLPPKGADGKYHIGAGTYTAECGTFSLL